MSSSNKRKRTSQIKLNSVCVFGGSTCGKNVEFRKAADNLGTVLATQRINLVYGGGIQGLKGSVVRSAITTGSKILSIGLKEENIPNFTLSSEFKVTTRDERIGHMIFNADAFIALPGGLDTLEDLSGIIFWANRNHHSKPLGLLNTNGFYDGFLSFLDCAVEQEFMPQAMRSLIVSASTAEQLLEELQKPTYDLFQFLKQLDRPEIDSSKKGEPETTLRL